VPSDNSARSQRGVLEDWNDARGFGFITPAGGGSRVFVHVSAFPRGPRPAPRL
jgi:cold shock CspA family protein